MTDNWFLQFLDWCRRTRWVTATTILLCLGIGGWGFYAYYGPQFEWIGLEHWYVWPFVPDCPLFVYLFALVVLGQYAGWSHPAITAFVAVGNVKYGVWTVFVLLYYFDLFFGPGGDNLLRSTILLLHVGMIPLGLLLWRTFDSLKRIHLALILAGLLVFDYFDYFFTGRYQIYPIGLPFAAYSQEGVPLPLSYADLGLVPWFTLAETVLLTWWLYATRVLPRRRGIAMAAPQNPGPKP